MTDERLPELVAVVTPVSTDLLLTRQAVDTRDKSVTRALVHTLQSGEHLILPQVNEPLTPTLAFGDGDSGFYEEADDVLVVSIAGQNRFEFVGGTFGGTNLASGHLLDATTSSTVATVIPHTLDTDTGLGRSAVDQLSLIAGAVQVANLTEAAGVVQLIVPLQNNAAAPSIAFGDGDTGIYEASDDALTFATLGISRWRVSASGQFDNSNSARASIRNITASATIPVFTPSRSDTDTGIGHSAADHLALIAGGLDCITVRETAAARQIGFYVTAPISLQTGVAVTDAAIHAALVALGLITA